LVVAGEQDRGGAREVRPGQEVDQPDDRAERARPERHRPAVGEDDAEPGPALAGRPSGGAGLEEHVVAEQQGEQHEREEGGTEAARQVAPVRRP
jgi:hypothetical protein